MVFVTASATPQILNHPGIAIISWQSYMDYNIVNFSTPLMYQLRLRECQLWRLLDGHAFDFTASKEWQINVLSGDSANHQPMRN